MFMGLQSRVEDAHHRSVGLQKSLNFKGTLVLPLNPQMKSLHTAKQQVGGHGIEARARNFPEMINPGYQISGAAYHTTKRIGVSAKKFCRTVNHEIGAES